MSVLVELSYASCDSSALSSSGMIRAASTFPSSTPHWSNESICQIVHRARPADERGRSVDVAEPSGHLCGIADGGGEADELDVLGTPDEHLLPDHAALTIGQEVDLVDDDVADREQGIVVDDDG